MTKKKNKYFSERLPSLADVTSATRLFASEATRFLYDIYINENFDEASTVDIIFELVCLFDEEANFVPLPEGYTLETVAERLREHYELRLCMMGLWRGSEDDALNIIMLAMNDFFEQLVQKFDDFDVREDNELVTEKDIRIFINAEETQKWLRERVCYFLGFK